MQRITAAPLPVTSWLITLTRSPIPTSTPSSGNPEAMNKMFDYYRERNIGDTSDIAPFLEYLDTANAIKPGYL